MPLKTLIPRAEIERRLGELAVLLNGDYHGQRPLFLVVLKGAFVFAADLIRRLDFPLQVDFMRVSSYGSATESSGEVRLEFGQDTSLKGRHVLLVEDIVDTGLTLSVVLDKLKREQPASLKVCALLDKPSRRRVDMTADYTGFAVPDEFVVGYGIDCDEDYRYLADICSLGEKE